MLYEWEGFILLFNSWSINYSWKFFSKFILGGDEGWQGCSVDKIINLELQSMYVIFPFTKGVWHFLVTH